MKNVDDLIANAAELTEQGLSKGEIADELNVSRETSSWLVDRSANDAGDEQHGTEGGPHDIHVDWSALGRDSTRLDYAGRAMSDLLSKDGEDVDLAIGIEKAGVPLATTVSSALETDLGTYTPSKHRWDDGESVTAGGTFSRNFADIRSRECYVVDDTITSGTTMREAIDAIREAGGEPVACCVLADKQGLDEIDGVPVYALLRVISVGDGD